MSTEEKNCYDSSNNEKDCASLDKDDYVGKSSKKWMGCPATFGHSTCAKERKKVLQRREGGNQDGGLSWYNYTMNNFKTGPDKDKLLNARRLLHFLNTAKKQPFRPIFPKDLLYVLSSTGYGWWTKEHTRDFIKLLNYANNATDKNLNAYITGRHFYKGNGFSVIWKLLNKYKSLEPLRKITGIKMKKNESTVTLRDMFRYVCENHLHDRFSRDGYREKYYHLKSIYF